jgi:hypothetical protein
MEMHWPRSIAAPDINIVISRRPGSLMVVFRDDHMTLCQIIRTFNMFFLTSSAMDCASIRDGSTGVNGFKMAAALRDLIKAPDMVRQLALQRVRDARASTSSSPFARCSAASQARSASKSTKREVLQEAQRRRIANEQIFKVPGSPQLSLALQIDRDAGRATGG